MNDDDRQLIFQKGVVPTAQRAAIVSGVELAVYDWTKKQMMYGFGYSDTMGTHFLASFTAGFAGAVASTPIDVVRVSSTAWLSMDRTSCVFVHF